MSSGENQDKSENDIKSDDDSVTDLTLTFNNKIQSEKPLQKSVNTSSNIGNHRMHRSAVRPFFCCGSQLSLTSLPDQPDETQEVETEFTNLSDSEEVIELVSDLSLEGACSSKNTKPVTDKLFKRQIIPRRKKSDLSQEKGNMRKKFWAVKLGGKLHVRKRTRCGNEQDLKPGKQNDCVCTSYKQINEPGRQIEITEDSSLESASCSTPLLHTEPCTPSNSNSSRCRSLRDLFRSNRNSITEDATGHQTGGLVVFRHSIMFDELYPVEDIDERRIAQRAREMEEGIDVSEIWVPSTSGPMLASAGDRNSIHCSTPSLFPSLGATGGGSSGADCLGSAYQIDECLYGDCNFSSQPVKPPPCITPPLYMPSHSQVDFMHCLVPDILQITKCSFYWGVMDRYQAEKLLENKPEGTFLLRDSAQEEFLFSVSFRRYGRSLHARIEQWNHKFSFDSHDPGVFASNTVCGLIEHYKDPSCCMFFEPMLTSPLHRNFPFSLQHLSRAVICDHTTYDGVTVLPLPRSLREYLMYYHYKQKVRVRRFDNF